jgi:D-arginine dehydrogenase
MAMAAFDIAIFGAGIAGASLAWRLAEHRSVALIERESQPGYHSTGRSAAMFMESYGPPMVRALTRASRSFYEKPPAGFTASRIVTPRGAMYLASPDQEAMLDATRAELAPTCPNLKTLNAAQTLALVPCLRPEKVLTSLLDPDAMDLDVHALHQGFLRGFRHRGKTLSCETTTSATLTRARHDGQRWHLQFADGTVVQATTVVNATGAWADEFAALCGARPIGLVPHRRSAFTFKGPDGLDASAWPVVSGLDETWYFKPDAGQFLGSPANADATHPHDVVPEELDIAKGIYAIEEATTLQIRRPTSTWAGLRSFVPDGEIVIGLDDAAPAFFWLAAQGGYGIQSAAGASALADALIRGVALPDELQREGVNLEAVSPRRFR